MNGIFLVVQICGEIKILDADEDTSVIGNLQEVRFMTFENPGFSFGKQGADIRRGKEETLTIEISDVRQNLLRLAFKGERRTLLFNSVWERIEDVLIAIDGSDKFKEGRQINICIRLASPEITETSDFDIISNL